MLAEEYRTQNRLEEAYNLDVRGLVLDSSFFQANLNVGIYLAGYKNEFNGAVRYFERAVAIDTNSSAACYYTELCYGSLGDIATRDIF